MTREEMWEEFENQLIRETRTSMTMSFDEAERMTKLGIKETVAKWKDRLEQEPCTDAISRQAAIDALYHVDEYNGRSVEAIRNLPSAEPKIGKWILSGGYWKCSECREKALLKLDKAKGGRREYEPVRSKHCPSCGTKMEEAKE